MRSSVFILFGIALCNGGSNWIDSSCPDYYLHVVCNNLCFDEARKCIIACDNDVGCISACNRNEVACKESCPCDVNCPNGCVNCSNPICGKEKAILVLSTNWIGNLPLVIGFKGEVDLDVNFAYDINTEVVDSCATSLHGEMWVLGGYNQKRQLSKIKDCRLTNVGELPFDYNRGCCNTFSFGIMLCFSKYATQECHSFDGINFKKEASSLFPHLNVWALGFYKNSPFVTGQDSSINGLKTEILDYAAGKWVGAPDFPFSNGDRISCYATASTDESVFIIGGYTKGSPDVTSRIAEYKNGKWIDGGNLAQARYGHGAITSESKTMIIGGTHNKGTKTTTELWELESLEGQMIIPTLPQTYSYGIGVFIVDVGYCSRQ